MSDNEVRNDITEAGNQKHSQRWMSDEKPPKRFNVINITWDGIKVYRGEGSIDISCYNPHQTKLTKALMNLSNDNLVIILEDGTQLFINDKSVEVVRTSEKFDVNVY